MLSKPLAFAVLAVACIGAAAGGAYIATRQRLAAVPVATTVPPPAASPATASSPAASSSDPDVQTAAASAKPDPSPAAPTPDGLRPAPATRSQASTRISTSLVSAADPGAAKAKPAAAAPSRRLATQPSSSDTAQADPVPQGPAAMPLVPAVAPASDAPPVSIQSPPVAPPIDSAPPADPPPPAPTGSREFDELVLPVASIVGVQIETPLSSETAQVEDRVLAHVTRDVLVDGRVAIPAGARVIGSVTLVDRGGKLKAPARIGIRFNTLILADGTEIPLPTQEITRDAEAPSADSAKKIGGAAIVGAILGGILGGGKGAVIGGTTGGAAGTAAVMAGDRIPAVIRQGATFNVRLAAPATIQVERR